MKIFRFWVLFILLLALVMFAWLDTSYLGSFDLYYMRHASHLLAVYGVVFLFMQFLLSSRIKIIEDGFGLDRMLHYHRIFGRIGLALIILHFVTIILYQWIATGTIFVGFAAWVGLTALVGFAVTATLATVHKKWNMAYEVWRSVHLINYLLFPVALLHVFSHARPGSLLHYLWVIVAVGFAAIVFYRLYRIYSIRSNPFEVVEVKQEADDIWSLSFSGPEIPYKPGQFLMIQLLRGSLLSSPHPFTISSSPTREHISITPKELGDFTSTIKDTKVGDKAYIDAPYGVFSFLNYESSELVFIAGGIGITPFISMLRYMTDKGIDKKVTLFWANRSEKNLCFQDELKKMEKEIPLTSVLIMSGQEDWSGEQGRINGKLLQKYLTDLEEKDCFVCGPPPMSKAVIADLESLGVPRHKIHFEVFEL